MDPICGSNEQLMIWAAACLASHAMLRPNEFLGTYGLEQRHLRLDQIQFLNDNGIEMHPEAHSPITGGRPPQCFYVNLGVTKADPLAHNKPILVEEPLAVTALWRWMMVRASGLDPGPQLFRQHGDRSLVAAKVAQRVRGLGGFGEGTDEDEIEIVRQRCEQVFRAGVADVGDFMARLLAPDADHLRHKTGQVGAHEAHEQRPCRAARDEIDDADAKSSHYRSPSGSNGNTVVCSSHLRRGA